MVQQRGQPLGQLVEIDGRRLRLTNLDKVLYPATGTTKGEVIDYYSRIAPAMLPHLRAFGRSLTGNADLADDLVQDTLERALNKWRLWRPGNLRNWLLTTMHHFFNNQLATENRLQYRDAAELQETPVAPTQGDGLALRDLWHERALAACSALGLAAVRGEHHVGAEADAGVDRPERARVEQAVLCLVHRFGLLVRCHDVHGSNAKASLQLIVCN